MKQSYLSSLIDFHSQLTGAIIQCRKEENFSNNCSLTGVGTVFAKSVTGKFYTEATLQKHFSDCVLDGGDYNNGPSVMCQSTFL